MPRLEFGASGLDSAAQARLSENFHSAFDRSCRDGLFDDQPLIDTSAHDRTLLHVVNAPESNVTSIYFSESAAPPAMLLESPFGPTPAIPSVEELHEAIYCVVRGATPDEEVYDGRCLVD